MATRRRIQDGQSALAESDRSEISAPSIVWSAVLQAADHRLNDGACVPALPSFARACNATHVLEPILPWPPQDTGNRPDVLI